MQNKLAIKKLRAYMARSKRAAESALTDSPCSHCEAAAIELKTLKMWLNDGIEEIKRSGLDNWTKTV